MQDMSKDGLIPTFDMDTKKWNKKYFVTFIDDTSGFCYVYLLHNKDEASDKSKVFKTKVELQQGSLIKRFRTDRGGLSQGFWGEAMAIVRLPNPKLKTLGERGIECIFVGYAEHSKAFRFSSDSRPSLKIPNGTKDIGGSVVPEEITKEVVRQIEPELRESKRNRTQKDFGPQFQLYLIEGTKDKGFKQKSGIVYFDTYAPVARISTIRLLIAMASIHNLIILHMDVKTAFLNCELDEEVYINQPQGLIMRSNENKVYKLIKSLYRLKQAPKQWHQKFDEVVLSNGYLLNQANKCVAALSQRIEIGDKGLDHNRISRIRFLNHSDSLPVAAKATNSDFIVEPVMQVCFLEA
ncbi:zinc finger, CCHC-type containing protein [Tanacetum coccineum]